MWSARSWAEVWTPTHWNLSDPTASFIAQQYYSVTFVSLRLYSLQRIFGARFKSVTLFFWLFKGFYAWNCITWNGASRGCLRFSSVIDKTSSPAIGHVFTPYLWIKVCFVITENTVHLLQRYNGKCFLGKLCIFIPWIIKNPQINSVNRMQNFCKVKRGDKKKKSDVL